jgi:hypothetical protein
MWNILSSLAAAAVLADFQVMLMAQHFRICGVAVVAQEDFAPQLDLP